MAAHFLVVVNQRVGLFGILMVDGRVEQHIQTPPFPGRYRDDGNPQHFRQPMQVDFHAPFLYDIHHVQSHDYRLAQFQQLQRQIQAPFQSRGIHHVYDHVHFITEDELPGNDFLHGIGRQAVGTGEVHQADIHIVAGNSAFYFFHRNTGPVGHFQVRPRIGVE